MQLQLEEPRGLSGAKYHPGIRRTIARKLLYPGLQYVRRNTRENSSTRVETFFPMIFLVVVVNLERLGGVNKSALFIYFILYYLSPLENDNFKFQFLLDVLITLEIYINQKLYFRDLLSSSFGE